MTDSVIRIDERVFEYNDYSGEESIELGELGMLTDYQRNQLSDMYRAKDLTPRQVSVAVMIMHGVTNKQIGDSLGRPEKTVKYQIGLIYKKLNIPSRSSFIVWSFEQAGLIKAMLPIADGNNESDLKLLNEVRKSSFYASTLNSLLNGCTPSQKTYISESLAQHGDLK